MALSRRKSENPLWTRDFTIITLGSVVSLFGNALSGFAMSLLVLDYTGSSFLYAVYIAVFTLPQIVMPIFSGALLDRFSRKKMIYSLDFLSAGLYVLMAILLGSGFFNFAVFIVFTFVVGSISSVYLVAYESFYPLLISEGNFSKAYSISSVLETLSSVMIPISTFLYNRIGSAPLLAANSACFLIAAIMETRIHTEEKYISRQKETSVRGASHGRQMLLDVREGFRYLLSEKGLLAVAVYFLFSSLAGGASQVIALPYFKDNYASGEYIYMLVFGCAVVGRAIGGLIHYRIVLPKKAKYGIALLVYCVIDVCEGSYLYFPIPVMMILCFITGILGITSYTIRISATQRYVPDEKKGRFNGAFQMLSTVGSLSGELLAGALGLLLPVRSVLSCFMGLAFLSALLVIGGQKEAVSRIYNTEC